MAYQLDTAAIRASIALHMKPLSSFLDSNTSIMLRKREYMND